MVSKSLVEEVRRELEKEHNSVDNIPYDEIHGEVKKAVDDLGYDFESSTIEQIIHRF